MKSQTEKVFLPTYEGCLVCGQKAVNAGTLGLRFQVTQGGVQVNFTPSKPHEGYRGIVHGGIVTAVLDETIGWAVAVDRKKYFMTGELTVRFIRPLILGEKYTARGWIVEHKSRYSIAEGDVKDAAGIVYAKATGKFFLMSDDQAKEVNGYLTFRQGDLQVLEMD